MAVRRSDVFRPLPPAGNAPISNITALPQLPQFGGAAGAAGAAGVAGAAGAAGVARPSNPSTFGYTGYIGGAPVKPADKFDLDSIRPGQPGSSAAVNASVRDQPLPGLVGVGGLASGASVPEQTPADQAREEARKAYEDALAQNQTSTESSKAAAMEESMKLQRQNDSVAALAGQGVGAAYLSGQRGALAQGIQGIQNAIQSGGAQRLALLSNYSDRMFNQANQADDRQFILDSERATTTAEGSQGDRQAEAEEAFTASGLDINDPANSKILGDYLRTGDRAALDAGVDPTARYNMDDIGKLYDELYVADPQKAKDYITWVRKQIGNNTDLERRIFNQFDSTYGLKGEEFLNLLRNPGQGLVDKYNNLEYGDIKAENY